MARSTPTTRWRHAMATATSILCFVFGSSSAAYQVEGAYDENGKGSSMWDHFTHTYPDRSSGDVAVDSYHLEKLKEDLKLLKDMGVDAYRFSITWPRILPGGTISKGVNQDGINYYNHLINELLANGIQPWVYST
ncbi:beta-glucosidase 13-like [Salvia divinorum]|uniref:Beta-glucosidase 13-like n=1 Tax=Salvia divinorum TaxID=28513 RepID=A0ABD1HVL7_SALDI